MPADDPSINLTHHFLIAMPGLEDEAFSRSVVYVCEHGKRGAMGLVINKPFTQLSFPDLLDQLGIKAPPRAKAIRLRSGGPVEAGRGFVLHSDDYMHDGTMPVQDGIALTATVDILKAMAEGGGPRRSLLALGYANWGPGQLETELTGNGWLTVPVDDDIVFDADLDSKWERALVKAGAHPCFLSGEAGHA